MREIRTKMLRMAPLNNEQLQKKIDDEKDEHLKEAYMEMLKGAEENPEFRIWYVPWLILLSGSNEPIGTIGFMGKPINHTAEVGYGIDEPYRNKGYGTEACRLIINWAFAQEEVYFIKARTEVDNQGSRKVLEKLKFEKTETPIDDNIMELELEKKREPLLPIFFCGGLVFGFFFGICFKDMKLIWVGALAGLIVGVFMRRKEERKRRS